MSYVLPTEGAYYSPYSEDVVVTQEPAATQMITQFLGDAPNTPTTPPLDQYGNPTTATASAGATGSAGSTGAATTAPTSTGSATTTPSQATTPGSIPAFDPRPC